MNLKCGKVNCKHNKQCACCADEVHIAKNTDCRTYEKDNSKSGANIAEINKSLFEMAPDMMKNLKNVAIKCNAKCLFNKKGICNANGITVLEEKSDGVCATFIEE